MWKSEAVNYDAYAESGKEEGGKEEGGKEEG